MIRVLVVDDQVLVRAGLRAVLQGEQDIEIVAEAATGAQALMLVAGSVPDVVLLDARLRDMPVTEACRAVRALLPAVAVGILATDADAAELRQQWLCAGARGFVLKDIARRDLAPTIRELATIPPGLSS
jgi:DNA-binding NarL/FixJ family response regulator